MPNWFSIDWPRSIKDPRVIMAVISLGAAAMWAFLMFVTNQRQAEIERAIITPQNITVIVKPKGDQLPKIGAIVHYSNLVRKHTLGRIIYNSKPPVGGQHSPTWQNCGFYNMVIPEVTAVHSLEHGAVWLTYKAGLSKDALARLQGFARQPYVIVSTYQGQSAAVVATAWGVQLRLDNVDQVQLEKFVLEFRNRKTGPEFGAPCTGGTGQPLLNN